MRVGGHPGRRSGLFDGPESPVSPSGSEPGSTAAAADGSTLKATAPTPQSPINNQQPEALVFVAGKSTATFASPSMTFSYQFEIRNSGNTAAVCPAAIVGGGSQRQCRPADHVRPGVRSALHLARPRGAEFRARPLVRQLDVPCAGGGYIRGNEVYDPLTNGKTVGEIVGPVTFIPGVGVRLEDPQQLHSVSLA